jgi:general secretion pathway protein G
MTLLEIMIVVAILGMLATFVVTNLSGTLANTKINLTQTQIVQLGASVQQYELDHGELPNSIKDLVNPGGGRAPYIKKGKDIDEWKNPFIYKRTSGGDQPFVIYSSGPDGTKNTSDDVYAKGSKK